MGGGGSSSKTESMGTTTSHGVSDQHGEFKSPDWYQNYAKQNYEAGLAEYQKPYEAYGGTVVPEFSDMTTDTLEWMRKNAGVYQPLYDQFGNDLLGLRNRGDVEAGSIENYMN